MFSISLSLIFVFYGCDVIVAQNNTDDSMPIVIEVGASTPLTPKGDIVNIVGIALGGVV